MGGDRPGRGTAARRRPPEGRWAAFPGRSTRPGAADSIDVRRCIAAFADWKQRGIGRESVRQHDLYGRGDEDDLAAFRHG
jgi:hypothetical protein